MLTVLWTAAALADCLNASTPDAFAEDVEATWRLRDEPEAFRRSMSRLQSALPCVNAPLDVATVAAFHRNRALVSKGAGDPSAASAAAGAAQRLAPETVAAWAEASPAFATVLAVAPPTPTPLEFDASLASRVYVDGTRSTSRPVGQPVVVQVFDTNSRPIDAGWVDSRAALPDWVAYPPIDCPAPVSLARILDDIASAEQAFATLDVPSFEAALEAVATALPCVDSHINPAEAAAIHRLEAIRLFTRGADRSALRSMQQARLLDPSFVPSAGVIPPGGTLDDLWTQAGRVPSPPWLDMDAPAAVQLSVDGIPSRSRPATLPTIVQVVTPTGAVPWTRYVPPLSALPNLGQFADSSRRSALSPALQRYHDDESERVTQQRRTAIGLGGVGLLLGAGVLYKTNTALISDFRTNEIAPSQLQTTRVRANAAASASAALAVAGVAGLGLSFAWK